MSKKIYWLLIGILGLYVTPASAAPILFTFTPGTSVLDWLGNQEGLSGTFDYDSATGNITTPQILVTGPGPESGQYNGSQLYHFQNVPVSGIDAWVLGEGGTHRIDLFFNSADLNNGSANLYYPSSSSGYFFAQSDASGPNVAYCLPQSDASGPNVAYCDSVDGVHGGVVAAVEAVPEPTSLSLLVVGLIGVVAMRRRRHAGLVTSR